MKSFCTRCQQWKPMADFSPKSRHPDGNYATVLSRCKVCLAELRRLRRKEDPDWARKVDKRDWERIKEDPEKYAHRRQLTRENVAVHRHRQTLHPKDRV